VTENEKADERANLAAGMPDARGGMAEIFRPNGGTPDTAPQVAGEHQAGDLGEKVGAGTELGRRPDPQDEIQNAEN